VFICPSSSCNGLQGSIRVLRCNFGRANPFYPIAAPPKLTGKEVVNVAALEDAPYYSTPIAPSTPTVAAATDTTSSPTSSVSTSTSNTDSSSSSLVRLCVVCGLPGSKQCGACATSEMGASYYCGVNHQRAHWKAGHNIECKAAATAAAAVAAASSSSSSSTTTGVSTWNGGAASLSSSKVTAMKNEIWPEQWIDIEVSFIVDIMIPTHLHCHSHVGLCFGGSRAILGRGLGFGW
jgi:hypothetical protein